MNEGMAQHTLSLAMDEDYLLTFFLLVLVHGLLEHIELIMQDVGSIHTRCRFQQLIGMQIYHEGAVILLTFLLALVGNDLLVLVHLFLQSLGVYHQGACHLVIVDNGEEQRRLLEEFVLLEDMQFVELHGVDAELHVDSWLQQERLVLLVGGQLNTDAAHVIEHLTAELLNEELGVGFHLSYRLQCPGIALSHEI